MNTLRMILLTCPYAKMVALYPSRAFSRRGCPRSLYTSFYKHNEGNREQTVLTAYKHINHTELCCNNSVHCSYKKQSQETWSMQWTYRLCLLEVAVIKCESCSFPSIRISDGSLWSIHTQNTQTTIL